MYSTYTLEFHRISRDAGGPLTIEPYDRAPVHGAPIVDPGAVVHHAPLSLLPAPRAIPI
jgi:hypothetical protein